jgi:tRNA (cytidine32/uridine32-2'-O)-methyltransferase
MNLDNIRIVLVGTTHPGNIGFAARALKTMALSRLHLVAPERFPDPQAEANATHGADVLAAARVHPDLDSALAGTALVAGLTARSRRMGAVSMDLRSFARQLAVETEHHEVALLFGREHSGLTNEELDRCQYVVHIPASPVYGVLNLAAAVQVVAYELHMAATEGQVAAIPSEAARFEHLEGFYQHLERLLDDVGFLRKQNPELLMRRLRRLFGRARPDPTEVDVLRGMLTAIERRLQRSAHRYK